MSQLEFFKFLRPFFEKFDLKHSYLCRQGLVYSSMFGISIQDGSRRYAEIVSSKFAGFLEKTNQISTIFAFHCFCGLVSIFVSLFRLNSEYFIPVRENGVNFCTWWGFLLFFIMNHFMKISFQSVLDSFTICFFELNERRSVVFTRYCEFLGNELKTQLNTLPHPFENEDHPNFRPSYHEKSDVGNSVLDSGSESF